MPVTLEEAHQARLEIGREMAETCFPEIDNSLLKGKWSFKIESWNLNCEGIQFLMDAYRKVG